jgi:SAM-dependent methyltransferase
VTEPGWAVFDRDAATHSGYLYTTSRLSSRLANQRSTAAILASGRFGGRSVLDVGCGDGFNSNRFWDAAGAKSWVALDPAEHAIQVANANKQGRPIRFEVGDAHRLAYPDDSFDLVLMQSILHHLDDDPRQTLREAFRVAPEVVIHEPNGNNVGLKVIQVASRYHREHGEKSYMTRRMRRWVEEAGGKVVDVRFAGFVPMFSPDIIAKTMKAIEPLLERAPGFRALACSVYVMVAVRSSRSS